MAKAISSPSKTKELLASYGLKAKKGFGQNFLVDPMITKKVAQVAEAEELVIEIGPGIGGLTEQLSLIAKKVIAYEIDESLKDVLYDNFKDAKNVLIYFRDFLQVDLTKEMQSWQKTFTKISVCANLPYYITSPVLFKLFEQSNITTITVMVQKEVGDRFYAKVHDSEYSALSVEAQSYYQIKKLFIVPGRSFNPSPKVDSLIVQLRRKEEIPSFNRSLYFQFVRDCFSQRRKTIRNNLQKKYTIDEIEKVLSICNISINQRPQNVSVEQYQKLFEVLYERKSICQN